MENISHLRRNFSDFDIINSKEKQILQILPHFTIAFKIRLKKKKYLKFFA